MKFTFDWLKSHLKTDLSYNEIAERLTNLGIEVEEIIDNEKKFDGFVVGFIKKAEKHPDADKLQICEVDIGEKTLQIVCGAKNARAGLYVAVAQVGALVPAFGEKLKKGNIRGIESQGMMCSTDELCLDDDGLDGIMELPNSLTPGQSVASALGFDDVVFDVSLTPNRSDCFSIRGLARDLAASGSGELLDLEISHLEENIENPIDVEIKTSDCDYFSTLNIQNVIGQTPDYIAKRLRAIGQKLIHFPVDVANYICLDIGQPMHIFDVDKLSKKIIVRNSRQGELIKTLDSKETILPENAIVVSSENGEPLSIAGIMGGENTAFSDGSKNILIESAYFNKIAIAKTGQSLRLTSDSRMRFERGINPENVDLALKYASSIITKNCKDSKTSNVKKYGNLPDNKKLITLTFSKFEALSNLTENEFLNSKSILEKLGITIKSIDPEKMILETPSWRHDLEIEEDIIEEILRIMGYENIKEVELDKQNPITQNYLSDKISDALVYNGYYEVKTFSFIDKKTASLFQNDEKKLITIKDALTIDFSILRPSVIASHLKSIRNSQNKSQKNSRIFEIGKKFEIVNEKIIEENMLTATISEKKNNRHWNSKQENVSIFDIKEDLEKILNISASGIRLTTDAPEYYHPGRSGSYIFQKDTVIAHFGEVHPSLLKDMDITGPVVSFELFLDRLPETVSYKVKNPIVMSQYQPTNRDFSFIVKKSVKVGDILNSINKLKIDSIKNISIFDIYESENIGKDNKAIAFEVLLQSDKSTLSDEQISDISQKIIEAISKNCEGILRDQ